MVLYFYRCVYFSGVRRRAPLLFSILSLHNLVGSLGPLFLRFAFGSAVSARHEVLRKPWQIILGSVVNRLPPHLVQRKPPVGAYNRHNQTLFDFIRDYQLKPSQPFRVRAIRPVLRPVV